MRSADECKRRLDLMVQRFGYTDYDGSKCMDIPHDLIAVWDCLIVDLYTAYLTELNSASLTPIIALKDFRCYACVEGGVLYSVAMMTDGSPNTHNGETNWLEVTEPVNQEFLDAVNTVLGTNFVMSQFSRR